MKVEGVEVWKKEQWGGEGEGDGGALEGRAASGGSVTVPARPLRRAHAHPLRSQAPTSSPLVFGGCCNLFDQPASLVLSSSYKHAPVSPGLMATCALLR